MRLTRADLPAANSQAVFQRMQTERQREAADMRAQRSAAAADDQGQGRPGRDGASRRGRPARPDQLRGKGEAERNRILAEAFGRDPDFFTFYRSMQAYEAGCRRRHAHGLSARTREFFRYFSDPTAGRTPAGRTTAGARRPRRHRCATSRGLDRRAPPVRHAVAACSISSRPSGSLSRSRASCSRPSRIGAQTRHERGGANAERPHADGRDRLGRHRRRDHVAGAPKLARAVTIASRASAAICA